jgi:hypothetical protein
MKTQPLKYGSERRMAIAISNPGFAWDSSEIGVVDLILFVVLVLRARHVQKSLQIPPFEQRRGRDSEIEPCHGDEGINQSEGTILGSVRKQDWSLSDNNSPHVITSVMSDLDIPFLHLETCAHGSGDDSERGYRSVIRANILTHTSKKVLKAMGPKSGKGRIWLGIQNKLENDQIEV